MLLRFCRPIINFAVHCAWNNWTIGDCSQKCGVGIRTNTRTIKYTAANGGIECDQPTSIEESCNMQQCPAHCQWNDWIIGDCSQSCGEGVRTNTRTEKYAVENGDKKCDEPTSIEENCNMEECVECRDDPSGLATSPHTYTIRMFGAHLKHFVKTNEHIL